LSLNEKGEQKTRLGIMDENGKRTGKKNDIAGVKQSRGHKKSKTGMKRRK